MIVLVTGASSSGKSAIAEEIAVRLSGGKQLYYIATMHAYGEEGAARVDRHRKKREGKNFITLEKYRDVHTVETEADATCLLECMSNLVANEMYDDDRAEDVANEGLAAKIAGNVLWLAGRIENLVIVTNEVFSDGCQYDSECVKYIEILGRINQELAGKSDVVIESVVGIPIVLKGDKMYEIV